MNANSIDSTDAVRGEADLCDADTGGENGDDALHPVIKIREEHSISRRDIDPDALKVLYRLARNNFIAYLVGGGVRDLLLGRKPKDFDISTNAKPEQIRALFRNCILIGRRFRLCHIRYGDKIIETSTFRTSPKQLADPADPDADLFQRDDNLFGSPAEDALRRDFTVNGLFYDIESFSIIDYVGGMEDLSRRRIRAIGDPCIRFREDPVRMVRAVRFASRLDFSLEDGTEEAIHQYGSELTKASPARLLEEITRLFAFSSGEKAVRLLRSTGLLGVILPEVDACLDADAVDADRFWKRLRALDCGDTVLPDATPALIFAVLLAEPVKVHLGRTWTFDETPRLRFDKLHEFMQPLAERLRFPKKLVDRIIHMYLNQNRFSNSSSSRGKRGSLANFVTQDAFHESLALAEITLASEGGRQTRLNQWRELLQERIYGRDDAGSHHHHFANGDRDRDRERERPAAVALPVPPAGVASDAPAEADAEAGEGGRRLSRSARRRRNKRLRRSSQEQARPDAADAPAEAGESPEAPAVPSPAPAPAPAEAPKPERGRNNRRRSRGKVFDGKGEASPLPAAEAESVESVPLLKPLTAAAFWKEPEPEPEPEPESEPAPAEKKRRSGGRKAKPDGSAKANGRSKASGQGEREATKESEPEKKPRAMDRAEEADIPMHWLDEI